MEGLIDSDDEEYESDRPQGLTEGCAQSLTMAAGGEHEEHDKRSTTMPKPTFRGFDSDERERAALANYTSHRVLANDVPPGGCTIEDVRRSSAGIDAWANHGGEESLHFERPDSLLKVGSGYATRSLCGLWAKQALMAASEKPQWERVILTVDSGASDTVLPPSVARNVPLTHSPKVGTEYEVANGGVVVNLGERKAEMKLKEHDVNSMFMSFQVVEVHKPLLAVSRLIEAGHEVRFNKADPHILLSTGVKVPMRNNLGTYEIEVWILNPGFTGPR
jgi:hypothetical protein